MQFPPQRRYSPHAAHRRAAARFSGVRFCERPTVHRGVCVGRPAYVGVPWTGRRWHLRPSQPSVEREKGARDAGPLRLEGQPTGPGAPGRRRTPGRHGAHVAAVPLSPVPAAQTGCLKAVSGGEPEVDAENFAALSNSSHLIAVPARRGAEREDVRTGKAAFLRAGCAGCHRPSALTGELPGFPKLSHQRIWPYTHLLLHDLGKRSRTGATTSRPPAPSGAPRRFGAWASPPRSMGTRTCSTTAGRAPCWRPSSGMAGKPPARGKPRSACRSRSAPRCSPY